MTATRKRRPPFWPIAVAAGACLIPALPVACRGKRGSSGTTTTVTVVEEQPGATLPGVVLEITTVSGASGAGGAFQVGDSFSITFTVKTTAGNALALDGLDLLAAMVSGPTFNYQRIIARQTDLVTGSQANADGSYTYTFADPIPSTYLAPLNDSSSFGAGDGELSGQALLSGTCTVGLEAAKDYTIGDETHRDSGNTTRDFLFGTATSIDAREVVTETHCNQCHQQIQAHGGIRTGVKLCLLCHTSGAEDRNVAAVEGGTPGVSIDFRAMIHKLHNGEHLPSVLGVTTAADGSRDYAATPQPYTLVGAGDQVFNFSAVPFPVWPNLTQPMPRDQGYTALTSAQKALEDEMRGGVTACFKCHGDPDGAGPIESPGQGDLAYAQPTRRACGACHDDVRWDRPYTANGQTMAAQLDDSNCASSGCHPSSGSSLSALEAHVHPLESSTYSSGLNVTLSSLVEAGTNDGDGTIDTGEKISVTLCFTDDAGAEVAASGLNALSAVISGPIGNRNLLLNTSIPTAALTGPQPYTTNVPWPVVLEHVGDSDAATGNIFATAFTPHWNVTGAATTVRVRTATAGGSTTTSAAAAAMSNYLDVADVTSFARNDFVVVEDGVTVQEEYLQVALVDGSRLWFNSALRTAHATGVAVQEVALTSKTAATDYTLNAAAGEITEVTEFGTGAAVVVSYTTDYVLPSAFPPPLNDSPDLGDTWGEWKRLAVADGTYTLGIWASRNIVVALFGESQTYRGTSLTAAAGFLVGSATTLDSYSVITSAENCNTCHNDVFFHGAGRRGFDNCILCHGTAGSEDRPRYVAGNAPATSGVTIDFRSLLHKVHRGEELANASTFTVVGFGAGAFPNNFTPFTYEEVVFPALPGRTKNCGTCHGSTTAWQEPAARDHASQTDPTRVWYAACTSCHDSSAAAAHADLQTSGGVESCSVCHGPEREFSVERAHREL